MINGSVRAEKFPYTRHTKLLRLEATRNVVEGELMVGEVAMRPSMPKSTMEKGMAVR